MHRFGLLLVIALVAAACSSSAEPTTSLTTPSTTTQTPTTTVAAATTSSSTTTSTTLAGDETTVTTYPAAFASPLNGLPSTNELNLDRRAIGVKVDNHSNARPQSGLMDADMIVEIRVEAGLTRFIALFHDNDTDYIGPIRSLRPTDSTIAAAVGTPLVISGGQSWIQSLVAGRGVGLVGPGAADLFRISSRLAPHNLYGDTTEMRRGADNQDYPDDPPQPLYRIDTWELPEATANEINLDWSDATNVSWEYRDGLYHRSQNGFAHEVIDRDGVGSPIAVEVLVVLTGEFVTVTPTGSGSAVPATETVGSGRALVFSRGRVWEGTWERSDIEDPFVLRNPDGTEAGVPPGMPWVSIFPDHRDIDWS